LAYGALTTLNPIYGLYSTFFPSLIYTVFATSKHLSVGTFAIVSIMILSTITKLEPKYIELELSKLANRTEDTQLDDSTIHDVRLNIATSLALWCGIIQVNKILFAFNRFSENKIEN
jgi:MFS superfamily sulfate permease-like transporter